MKLFKSKANARGQMAIFIALIFQVLFVFFAMAINVGLVVHDKINLQNAVDLATYYAAQRQAEMLNVIAHTNYQIRQAWKLLNFRYYVWGSLGLSSHPANNLDLPNGDVLYSELDPLQNKFPIMCVAYRPPWLDLDQDNICQSKSFFVPSPPEPVVLLQGFGNIAFRDYVRGANIGLAQNCQHFGAYNWWFAANTYVTYWLDQLGRKELIRALARNLARPPKEMVDLNGELIYTGAFKTFEKNLTRANSNKIMEFELFNPLQGKRPDEWLPEIDVWFTMGYQDFSLEREAKSGCGAAEVASQIDTLPRAATFLRNNFGAENVDTILSLIQQSTGLQAGNSMRTSIGIEKNPWILAYMGAKATTAPRQIFFPFGDPVEFKAKAYAMPFGGRVGPWYGQVWGVGAPNSSGAKVGLFPERLAAGGIMNSGNIKDMVPNSSRYPGDVLGMSSRLAQISINNLRNLNYATGSFKEYASFLNNIGPAKPNDLLPWNDAGISVIRDFELAAIAPDLFDITYYSIEPNFGENYLPKIRRLRNALGLAGSDWVYPRGDLGAHDRTPESSSFSVKDQMAKAQNALNLNLNLQNLNAFWFVRDRQHLLTDWTHGELYGEYFDFPVARFGNCDVFDDNAKVRVPGGCLGQGGRSGYSVKIVARDYLTSQELPLGGPGQSPGGILNPPPDEF